MADPRCEQWAALHDSGVSWAQIAAQEEGLTGEAIRKRVRRWKLEQGTRTKRVPSATVLDPLELPDDWVDKLYENAKEQSRLRLETEKAETTYNVQVDDDKPIMLVWTGDQHLLDGGTDHELWDEDVGLWTTTEGVYIGAGGDWANWYSPAVLPRAMPANTLPSDLTEPVVRRQIEKLHGDAKRVLFGVVGNHDEFPAATGWHPIDRIYRDLGIPNLGPGGNVVLHFGDVKYRIAARHHFNFSSALNDTNSMRNLWMQAGGPDIVCTAHLHRPTLHMPTMDGRDTVWIRCGSYKRNDHYAKRKNFVHTRPDPADMPGVILFPDEKDMIPFRNYRDGLALLTSLRDEYS